MNYQTLTRFHVIIIGRRNSGKSSLVNAITCQQTALVSSVAGTTTDPVRQSMELPGAGACLFIDTAGFDDHGPLGRQRVERTGRELDSANMAVMVIDNAESLDMERQWLDRLKARGIATIVVANKADAMADASAVRQRIETQLGVGGVLVASAMTGLGIESIRRQIARVAAGSGEPGLLDGMVAQGDVVLLVMPQDAEAPKGRLILPQVQTLRALIDMHCVPVCCAPEEMPRALEALHGEPQLIITDSNVFDKVYRLKPARSRLTSFSVLQARQKGDILYFAESARAIARLTPQSRVLIAEACTHAPQGEDIGRERIPMMLHKRVGRQLEIDFVSGKDFPADLSPYSLVIHCGSCMFNRCLVMSRIEAARRQGVPMTNYGIAIAYVKGILDKVEII